MIYNIFTEIVYLIENMKCHCKNNECNCFIFKSWDDYKLTPAGTP